MKVFPTRIGVLMRIVAAGFFVAIAGGCASAQAEETAQRIIAVGDLHGDYEAYETILRAAGLIDGRNRWTGGETILVQTGDVADRGPDTRKIIEHLQKLQKRAAKKGGAVIALVGNHEAMNMTRDLRYVHPGEYEAFRDRNSKARREALFEANREALEAFYLERDPTMSSEAIREAWFADWPLGKINHQRAWAPSGEIGAWVSGNPAVVKVGATLFVHGGLSAEYSALSIDEINARVAEALTAQDASPESIIADPLGPLWYRGLVRRPKPEPDAIDAGDETPAAPEPALEERPSPEEEIVIVLDAYNAARIVVGHTPNLEGIRALLGGRVIQVDTGAADYYGGVPAYLEIIGDTATAHNVADGVAVEIAATSESQE